ncbi:MAG TPA: cupin domain-containing protein [Flavobacteriales bacterium]|nr:cupin domain-containing protein [Flavobacteriales bacterium]
MKFIDFTAKPKVQIWEGINAAFFHSSQITFGHVELDKGAIVGEHKHVHEQWTHVIEGEMEFTIDGETTVLKPGMAAFMASNVVHSARAITAVKVIDCFLPVREDFVELERKG